MRFNDEKILEDADMLDVCRKFDIRTVRRGSNTFISCPEHVNRAGKADRNFDKCYIKKGHYYCFSCGAHGNVIRLVQNVLRCSGYEARKQICESLGGVSPYIDAAYNAADEIPYNKKELEALGLCTVAYGEVPRCLADNKKELEESQFYEGAENVKSALYLDENGRLKIMGLQDAINYPLISYLYTGCSRVSANIRELYKEDRETFFWLINNKADEMSKKYEAMLSANIAAQLFSQQTAYYVNSIYRTYLGICKRIRNEINETQTACLKNIKV